MATSSSTLVPKGLSHLHKHQPARSKVVAKALAGAIDLSGLKKDSSGYVPSAMTQRLVNALGNNTVAAPLGVNQAPAEPVGIRQSIPNEENRAQLADLYALVGHLHSAFTPAQAVLWLEGHNAHLDARPVDIYRFEGAASVIEAIRAHEQGAFA